MHEGKGLVGSAIFGERGGWRRGMRILEAGSLSLLAAGGKDMMGQEARQDK
jgi:hypothetical protein